jgi:hypothetical protein
VGIVDGVLDTRRIIQWLRAALLAGLPAALANAGCSGEPTCKPSVGAPANDIQVTGFVCSDNATRAIECVPDGTKGPLCTCIADGARGATFHMNTMGPTESTAITVARESCAWKLKAL